MHASRVLQRWLRRRCPGIHTARTTALAAVVTVVEALVLGGRLTLAPGRIGAFLSICAPWYPRAVLRS